MLYPPNNGFDPHLSFFLSASTAATYIFTAATCTTTIITLNLVHSMLSFSISYSDLLKLPSFADLTQREGIGVCKKRPKDRVKTG